MSTAFAKTLSPKARITLQHSSTAFQYVTRDLQASVWITTNKRFYCVNTRVGHNHHSLAYSNPKDALRVYYNVRRILAMPANKLKAIAQGGIK